jgi:tetratricopeptide (TPR) repeat protein
LAVTGNCSTNVINLAVAYHRAGRYQELISFADSKIPVAPPEYKGRLAAIKASAFYYMQKYELAIATANQALEWGGIEVTPCWTLAISNFELGKLDEAARWLAKARASFERMLKEKAGPKASPGSKTLLGPATSGGRS